jgi:CO/xanthine dehydrogenase Mo-binding subunit
MTKPAPSSTPKLPVSLAANPVLSSWVRVSSEGQVMISPGKVEIGQGIVTALAQIAADELDVDISRVHMIRPSTAASPNEGVTSGSLSVQQSGRAIRHACAEIRQIFLDAASDRLGVRSNALDVKDGTISGPGNVSTSYWESSPRRSSWIVMPRQARRPRNRRSATLPAVRSRGWIFPTRFSPAPASFTISR